MATTATAPHWWQYPVTGPYGVNGERGVDLAMPVGTPIYAPYGGTVLGRTDYANATDKSAVWGTHQQSGYYSQTGYNLWGGEVDLLSPIIGLGTNVQYFLHLDQLLVKPGDVVAPGSLIGYSGGQNSNSTTNVVPGYTPTHTASPAFSSGPHIEWGIYTGAWQSNVDPTPFLAKLRSDPFNQGLGNVGGTSPALLPSSSSQLAGQAFSLADLIGGIPQIEQSVKSGLERTGLVFFGMLLVLIGVLVLFFSSQSGQAISRDAATAAISRDAATAAVAA